MSQRDKKECALQAGLLGMDPRMHADLKATPLPSAPGRLHQRLGGRISPSMITVHHLTLLAHQHLLQKGANSVACAPPAHMQNRHVMKLLAGARRQHCTVRDDALLGSYPFNFSCGARLNPHSHCKESLTGRSASVRDSTISSNSTAHYLCLEVGELLRCYSHCRTIRMCLLVCVRCAR
jgi:hypothetical protein